MNNFKLLYGLDIPHKSLNYKNLKMPVIDRSFEFKKQGISRVIMNPADSKMQHTIHWNVNLEMEAINIRLFLLITREIPCISISYCPFRQKIVK
jgi:hypothetical protein